MTKIISFHLKNPQTVITRWTLLEVKLFLSRTILCLERKSLEDILFYN